MTARGLYTLVFGSVMMITALSVGSSGAFLLGAVALVAFCLSLISILCAYYTCSITQTVQGDQVSRGASCSYALTVRLYSPIPIAPLQLRVCLPSRKQSEFVLPARLWGETGSDNDFPCPHVGVFPVGVLRITFCDCFGLFSLAHTVRDPLSHVVVLPNPRDVKALSYSPGEGESSIALRAQADRTTPADTRSWQDGDDMKRIHWKLSMRRQELMVHTYETPQRPDALILLDCGIPAMPDGEDASGVFRANIIDALTETTAGILKSLLDSQRIVRMPLTGSQSVEFSGQQSECLPQMLAALARESFSMRTDFVRMLLLSSRRMRRTGSTVILSSRLTPAIADTVIALGRMGPHTRFVLISSSGTTKTQNQLMHLLESSDIETELVVT